MKLLEINDYFLVKNGSKIYEFEVLNTFGDESGDIQVRLVRKFNGEEFESIKKKRIVFSNHEDRNRAFNELIHGKYVIEGYNLTSIVVSGEACEMLKLKGIKYKEV